MNAKETKDIIGLLGLELMSESEQTEIITDIGDLVMESVLLRLVAEMSKEQQEALDQFMESDPTSETLMNHLASHYSSFTTIWDEEVKAFRRDALSVLKNTEGREDS